MVLRTIINRETSIDLLEVPSKRRRPSLRIVFLILVASAVLLFYKLDLTNVSVSDIWAGAVKSANSTTYSNGSTASYVTLNTTDLQWISATTSGNFNLSPAVTSEQCISETTYTVSYPCKYKYILYESERCQINKPFLVLMVPVAPNNRAARDAIRTTWGSEKLVGDKVVSVFFVLGQPRQEEHETLHPKILQESEEHHDIIQSDFLDSYKNLTIKTIVIMEWLVTYCQTAVYAMKIDSDMFLNVDRLVNMLLEAPRESYITGLVVKGAIVLRNPNSKWYLPKHAFAEDHYPPYALGLGYVFSLDLPSKLIEIAKYVQPVYIEDVFIGMCMKYLKIPFTSQADQSLFNVFPVPYDRCRYSKLIATTTHNLQQQVQFWKDLKKPGPACIT